MSDRGRRPEEPLAEERLRAPRNMVWTPRPGWVAVRLIGTCADPSLRRGQVVLHQTHEDQDYPGSTGELAPGTMVIVLARESRLVEDDFHLLPEEAIIATGEPLP